jgi:hypothetical protein
LVPQTLPPQQQQLTHNPAAMANQTSLPTNLVANPSVYNPFEWSPNFFLMDTVPVPNFLPAPQLDFAQPVQLVPHPQVYTQPALNNPNQSNLHPMQVGYVPSQQTTVTQLASPPVQPQQQDYTQLLQQPQVQRQVCLPLLNNANQPLLQPGYVEQPVPQTVTCAHSEPVIQSVQPPPQPAYGLQHLPQHLLPHGTQPPQVTYSNEHFISHFLPTNDQATTTQQLTYVQHSPPAAGVAIPTFSVQQGTTSLVQSAPSQPVFQNHIFTSNAV